VVTAACSPRVRGHVRGPSGSRSLAADAPPVRRQGTARLAGPHGLHPSRRHGDRHRRRGARCHGRGDRRPVRVLPAVLGLAVNAVSHYAADRRKPLLSLAEWLGATVIPGKDEFWHLGMPRPGRDDNPRWAPARTRWTRRGTSPGCSYPR